jgi:hypothetical protein
VDSGLRPGQFIRARITTEELTGRLVVPRESVVKADDEQVIYVVEGDKAVQMRVKTGLRDGNLIEVEVAHRDQHVVEFLEVGLALSCIASSAGTLTVATRRFRSMTSATNASTRARRSVFVTVPT